MTNKKTVLFICGGVSGEHEISLISTKHVLKALDRERYEALVLLIQKDGQMGLVEESDFEKISDIPDSSIQLSASPVYLRPYSNTARVGELLVDSETRGFDVAFPLLHGKGGEDGSLQGFLELSRIPFVGCDLRSSAICMDKVVAKVICERFNLPVVPFIELRPSDSVPTLPWNLPYFVKPATTGSSLGVQKVRKLEELESSVKEAFKYDSRVLIEPAVDGRELEVAVLEEEGKFVCSPPGEIQCAADSFYSYEAKYMQPDQVQLIAPASLDQQDLLKLQRLATDIFKTLGCRALARIDFFRDSQGQFLLNEVNTIPGFTTISMYPKLLQLAGVSYTELVSRLIQTGLKASSSISSSL